MSVPTPLGWFVVIIFLAFVLITLLPPLVYVVVKGSLLFINRVTP